MIDMKTLSVATFNVRGLVEDLKKDCLGTDVVRYKVDVVCLQETKIKKGCDKTVNNSLLTCFPTSEAAYGIGFVVSSKWKDKIYKQWKVNDRIAIIQLNPDIKDKKTYTKPIYTKRKMINGIRIKLTLKNKRNMITIINCYAPHSEHTRKNPKQTEKFYDQVDSLIRKYKNKSF